jgi:hypothetical protein
MVKGSTCSQRFLTWNSQDICYIALCKEWSNEAHVLVIY